MIGVYGGTFNPVHYGHLRTALEVREIFSLDQIRLVPSCLPPHREPPEVSAEARLQMLQLAVDEVPGMCVDRRELDREGPSYMIDTLRSLRGEFDQCPLVLFVGSDAFAHLNTWYRWRFLFDYAHIVVMTRPGYRYGRLETFFTRRVVNESQALRDRIYGCLLFQQVTQLDISATFIRELISTQRDPRFLLPDAVINFIQQHQLYRS